MLLSDDTAIIPIGNSCLVGFQLKRSQDSIESLLNQKFQHTSSFFQWIFQDSRTTHRIFLDFILNNKEISIDDISIDPLGQRWPYVKTLGSYFCHDGLDGDGNKTNHGDISDEEKIINVASKYSYLIKKMNSLKSKRKRIFILSNADLGIKGFHIYREGHIDWEYTDKEIELIIDSINSCFTEGENKFIFVLNKNNKVIRYKRDNLSVFRVKNVDGFYDDNESWDEIFNKINEGSVNLTLFDESKYSADISPGCNYKFFNTDFVSDEKAFFKISYDPQKGQEVNSALTWGPYVRLSSGFYEAKIIFDQAPVVGSAFFRITSNIGQKIIIQSTINEDINNFENVKTVRFNVENKESHIEACIFPDKSFSALVKSIIIKRIEN